MLNIKGKETKGKVMQGNISSTRSVMQSRKKKKKIKKKKLGVSQHHNFYRINLTTYENEDSKNISRSLHLSLGVKSTLFSKKPSFRVSPPL